MYLDLAPMEGLTTALFRRLHHRYFPGVDRYYLPFVSPTADRRFTPRDQREILPEWNDGITAIPQLMTRDPEDFLWAAGELHAMGYTVVNLNAGCPSGTVTAKGKGAGMLTNVEALDRFLDRIFENAPCAISVKTRLGMESPEEFGPILEIYNRYPIEELILHPRVRKDFYRHPVRWESFETARQTCVRPLTYNGSIVTAEDHRRLTAHAPDLHGVMIGQGLIADPFLAGKIRGLQQGSKSVLRDFHDELLEGYAVQFGSLGNAVKRMKELWVYLASSFDGDSRSVKPIFKARTPEDYRHAVDQLFRELPLLPQSRGEW